jgi:hypothetical protein
MDRCRQCGELLDGERGCANPDSAVAVALPQFARCTEQRNCRKSVRWALAWPGVGVFWYACGTHGRGFKFLERLKVG